MNVIFLEVEDYETENLLNSMSCVGLNNIDSGAGMPFAYLKREHYTVGDFNLLFSSFFNISFSFLIFPFLLSLIVLFLFLIFHFLL